MCLSCFLLELLREGDVPTVESCGEGVTAIETGGEGLATIEFGSVGVTEKESI